MSKDNMTKEEIALERKALMDSLAALDRKNAIILADEAKIAAAQIEAGRKDACTELAKNVAEIELLVRASEKLADKYHLDFTLRFVSDMGGYYSNGQWQNSSASC